MKALNSPALFLRVAAAALALTGLNLLADTVTLTNTSYPSPVSHFQSGIFFNDSLSGWGFPSTLTLDPADNHVVVNVNAAPGEMFVVDASSPDVFNVKFNFFLSYLGDATSVGPISNGAWNFDMVSGAAPVFDPGSFAEATATQFALSPFSLVMSGYSSFTGFSFSFDLGGTPGANLNLGASYLSVTGLTFGDSPVLGVTSTSVPETTGTLSLFFCAVVTVAGLARLRRAGRVADI